MVSRKYLRTYNTLNMNLNGLKQQKNPSGSTPVTQEQESEA